MYLMFTQKGIWVESYVKNLTLFVNRVCDRRRRPLHVVMLFSYRSLDAHLEMPSASVVRLIINLKLSIT